MKKKVGFWVHVMRKPKGWWSDNITKENLKLWGFVIGIVFPWVLAAISPVIISVIFGYQALWQLLGWLSIIPAVLFSWWVLYQDDPEYEYVDVTSSTVKGEAEK